VPQGHGSKRARPWDACESPGAVDMPEIAALPSADALRLRSVELLTDLAAVVRELVENSIDAGASQVVVRIAFSSLSVCVSDNGCGMARSLLTMVGEQRYLSSKPPVHRSLHGCRGEALHSIAQLAGLEIRSRAAGSDELCAKTIRHGKSSPLRRLATHAPRTPGSRRGSGTTCWARELFRNWPVRRCKLRRRHELVKIQRVLGRAALRHPRLGFTLFDADARKVLWTVPAAPGSVGSGPSPGGGSGSHTEAFPGARSLQARVQQLFGDTAMEFRDVAGASGDLGITGLLRSRDLGALPSSPGRKSPGQTPSLVRHLFVNQRTVPPTSDLFQDISSLLNLHVSTHGRVAVSRWGGLRSTRPLLETQFVLIITCPEDLCDPSAAPDKPCLLLPCRDQALALLAKILKGVLLDSTVGLTPRVQLALDDHLNRQDQQQEPGCSPKQSRRAAPHVASDLTAEDWGPNSAGDVQQRVSAWADRFRLENEPHQHNLAPATPEPQPEYVPKPLVDGESTTGFYDAFFQSPTLIWAEQERSSGPRSDESVPHSPISFAAAFFEEALGPTEPLVEDEEEDVARHGESEGAGDRLMGAGSEDLTSGPRLAATGGQGILGTRSAHRFRRPAGVVATSLLPLLAQGSGPGVGPDAWPQEDWPGPGLSGTVPDRAIPTLLAGAERGPWGATDEVQVTRTMLSSATTIGQAAHKFVLAAAGPVLLCLDQHAADERVKLEALLQETRRGPRIQGYQVSPPIVQTVPPADHVLLDAHDPNLRRLGFDFELREDPEKLVVVVTRAPLLAGVQFPSNKLLEVVRELGVLDPAVAGIHVLPASFQRILNYRACHSAITFGDHLDQDQCSQLLASLATCALPFQCAHGRPSATVLCQDLSRLSRGPLVIDETAPTRSSHGVGARRAAALQKPNLARFRVRTGE